MPLSTRVYYKLCGVQCSGRGLQANGEVLQILRLTSACLLVNGVFNIRLCYRHSTPAHYATSKVPTEINESVCCKV